MLFLIFWILFSFCVPLSRSLSLLPTAINFSTLDSSMERNALLLSSAFLSRPQVNAHRNYKACTIAMGILTQVHGVSAPEKQRSVQCEPGTRCKHAHISATMKKTVCARQAATVATEHTVCVHFALLALAAAAALLIHTQPPPPF